MSTDGITELPKMQNVDLQTMSPRAALKAIRVNHAKLVETQLLLQLGQVNRTNKRMAELNQLLSPLQESEAVFGPNDPDSKQFWEACYGSPSSSPPFGVTAGQALITKINDAARAAGKAPPFTKPAPIYESYWMCWERSFADIKELIASLKDEITSLATIQNGQSVTTSSLMSQYDQHWSLIANEQASFFKITGTIVDHIR